MNRSSDLLQRLAETGALRPFDVEIGRCLLDLEPDADPALGLIAATVSLAVSQGHSCLPLAHLENVLNEASPEGAHLPRLPEMARLMTALETSRWAEPADDVSIAPLLYNPQGEVWLGRYFHYEGDVARVLRGLLQRPPEVVDSATLRAALQPFFKLDGELPDWQAVAALTGLVSPLTVITGGPGTGKTTTVLWLLAAWIGLRLAAGDAPPRIHLAAPTGKAAARLSESLRVRVAELDITDDVRAAIPVTASTLHRLLGVRRGSSRFHHHAGHPLNTDLVVVDEVSMVDLPLMAKLLDALPPTARLVLLGDRDQLASVEAGNVLAAVCAAAGEDAMSPSRAALVKAVTGTSVEAAPVESPFADAVIGLRRSHRFGHDSGLGRVAAHIRDGEVDILRQELATDAFADVLLDSVAAQHPVETLVEAYLDRFAELAACDDSQQALQRADKFRILTAMRDGPSGNRTLNAAFEQALRQRLGVAPDQVDYPGRLLLVTRNDYGTELFNGDIGIVLGDAEGTLRAWFPAADGSVRKLALAALPECESAYAMTIHKSQGSEFDEVAIVLPREDARVLSRELLYTAVTRARTHVHLIASDAVLAATISRSTRRFSGLADRLLAFETASGVDKAPDAG